VLDAGSGGREQSQIGVEGVDRHGVTARANRLRACEPRAEDRGGVSSETTIRKPSYAYYG